jgi:glycosyltransferase involved in cell wall biosynthesis
VHDTRINTLKQRIAFVSTMDGYSWGGSEELWSRAALQLLRLGFSISASVPEWRPLHGRVQHLRKQGVNIWLRPKSYPNWKRAWHRTAYRDLNPIAVEVDKMISVTKPRLVVLSSGFAYPPIDLIELCVKKRIPFVTIGQANYDTIWMDDDSAARYRPGLSAAARCYFVSKSNLRLAEKQIGCQLYNAEVVWNPFNVDYHASPSWPKLGPHGGLRLACVARLDPPAKGQDILFEVLTAPQWASRPWHLYLYGEGPMRNVLERLAQSSGLSDRVVFAGQKTVEEIWASNHVLVMPSRAEGMPLAMVEAMLCARPVIATDVASISEIVEDGITGFLADAPAVPRLANAMERFWESRARMEEIGKNGAKRIRRLVPPDPAGIFTGKLRAVLHEHLSKLADG